MSRAERTTSFSDLFNASIKQERTPTKICASCHSAAVPPGDGASSGQLGDKYAAMSHTVAHPRGKGHSPSGRRFSGGSGRDRHRPTSAQRLGVTGSLNWWRSSGEA
jgi:hypothetical protein